MALTTCHACQDRDHAFSGPDRLPDIAAGILRLWRAPDHWVVQPAGPSERRSATLRSGASAQMLPAGRHLGICCAPHAVHYAGFSQRLSGLPRPMAGTGAFKPCCKGVLFFMQAGSCLLQVSSFPDSSDVKLV